MPRSKLTDKAISQRKIALYDEDWNFLSERFGPGSDSGLRVGTIIREIVAEKVGLLRKEEERRLEARASRLKEREVTS